MKNIVARIPIIRILCALVAAYMAIRELDYFYGITFGIISLVFTYGIEYIDKRLKGIPRIVFLIVLPIVSIICFTSAWFAFWESASIFGLSAPYALISIVVAFVLIFASWSIYVIEMALKKLYAFNISLFRNDSEVYSKDMSDKTLNDVTNSKWEDL